MMMVFKMFVFQSTFSTIDFKQKNNEYKVSDFSTIQSFIYHKIINHKIELQFNNSVLDVEKNNFATKVLALL